LTVFEKIEAGEIDDSGPLRQTLTDMIRVSSNSAATRAIRLVGFDSIAETLEKPEYRLYDLTGNGGLWVGKAYDPTPAVRRDPLNNFSHGATARQAARFFALLDKGLLISRERSREMLEILGDPGIQHKFVRGLASRPEATIYRKSGSFRQHHADAALIEHNGHRYIAAALVDDPRGGRILEKLILTLDDIIVSGDGAEATTRR
jgi:beta-lactamase class A